MEKRTDVTNCNAAKRNTVDNHIFWKKVENVRRSINAYRSAINVKGKDDLYFSEHLAFRIVERKLDNDIAFIIKLTKYFMEEIFYKTTFNQRSYLLSWRNLQVAITINLIMEHRHAVVKTVFQNDSSYECDEIVELND